MKYEISLSDGELSNTLIVACGIVELYFGNTGTTRERHRPERSTGDKELFKIPFPGTPIPVTFSFNVGGSLGYDVYYDIYSKEFTISETGELYAKAELGAGIDGSFYLRGEDDKLNYIAKPLDLQDHNTILSVENLRYSNLEFQNPGCAFVLEFFLRSPFVELDSIKIGETKEMVNRDLPYNKDVY